MNMQFAICIKSDDPDLLTPRMLYQVLPDESAARSHYLRVIDNEGEDYLYPEDYFLRVHFPNDIEYTLTRMFSLESSHQKTASEI
jgi:hypothetical protein